MYEVWEFERKALAVNTAVHAGRSLTLHGFSLSARHRTPFHPTGLDERQSMDECSSGLLYTNSPTRVELRTVGSSAGVDQPN
jgi:hypothetical protein